MAIRRRKHPEAPVEMQMGPMIDMVFLLLVFFMVTSKPIKQESDINLGLPGAVAQEEAVDIPDEQRIEIQASGTVVLNELDMGAHGRCSCCQSSWPHSPASKNPPMPHSQRRS
jgi:biopolymer transport protein ExbD